MFWKRLPGTCGSVAAFCASLLLLGCGTSNTSVRTVNASPGLTNYTVQVGLIPVASSLPYGTEGVQPQGQYTTVDASGNYRQVGAGSNQKVFLYQGSNSASPIATTTSTLLKNSYYTVVNVGAPGSVQLLVLPDGYTAPSGGFGMRLVMASQRSGPVDIYLTAAGAPVSGSPTFANIQFAQTQTYVQVPSSAGEIQVTPAGNPAHILFAGTFTASSGNNYTGFFLDPPSTASNAYGVLLVKDPVLTAIPQG
jgi:hypothetical protein